jgi:hypothetical protein
MFASHRDGSEIKLRGPSGQNLMPPFDIPRAVSLGSLARRIWANKLWAVGKLWTVVIGFIAPSSARCSIRGPRGILGG